MLHLGDITKLNGAEVETVDCIIGGSPCQDLSIAGKRAGLDGARSGLFMEQMRIIKEMRAKDGQQLCSGRTDESVRPRYMVWENVPGAFSSNKGDDFRVVLEEVARVVEEGVSIPRPPKGKWQNSGAIIGESFSIAWRVFDAQFWGVPQRRKRICLVADFNGFTAPSILFNEVEHNRCSIGGESKSSVRNTRGASKREVQPISESLSGNTEQSKQTWEEASFDTSAGVGTSSPAITMQVRCGCSGGGQRSTHPSR